MSRTWIATLLAGALTSVAGARVNETVTECEERYGEGREIPLSLGSKLDKEKSGKWSAKVYSARDLAIQIVFEGDRAEFVGYTNESAFKIAGNSAPLVELTGGEIEFLMRANLPENSSWSDYDDQLLAQLAPSMKAWRSSDEKLFAAYDRQKKEFFVCTSEFWKAVVDQLRVRHEGTRSTTAEARLEGL